MGALITMGCVLSIDPKVDELLRSLEKDSSPAKVTKNVTNQKIVSEDCDDFEEGYSDDEMFTMDDRSSGEIDAENEVQSSCFDSWILDICSKNMGWMFKGNEVVVSEIF